MIEFVLIVMIYNGDYNPAFDMQEFNSRASCERAKTLIRNNYRVKRAYISDSERQTLVCVEK